MNFLEMLDSVCENMLGDLLENKSFEEIVFQIKEVYSSLDNSQKDNYSFRVREDILGEMDWYDEDKIYPIPEDFSNLCGIEIGNERLFFAVREKDREYYIVLMGSIKNGHYYDTLINLKIKDDVTHWDILSVVKDENEYYYDYKREYFSKSRDGMLIISEDVEDKKDEDFGNFFGISKDKVKEVRLNFAKNRELLNNSLASKDMMEEDKKYSIDNVVFDGPFIMSELWSLILASELIEVKEEGKRRLEAIVSNVINSIGSEGEFVISHNLLMNMQAYVYMDYNILNTTGYVVRKDSLGYTLFNVNITHNGVMVIPSSVSKDNLRTLYNSSSNSEHTKELDEFFGLVNIRKLD